MKNLLIATLFLSAVGFGVNGVTNAFQKKAPESTVVNTETQGYVKAFECTGDRVIARKGPGKNYGQVVQYGQRIYLNKGDIVLPGFQGVKNGYRNVYIPNADFDCEMWVSVKYLKKTIWNDGYDD